MDFHDRRTASTVAAANYNIVEWMALCRPLEFDAFNPCARQPAWFCADQVLIYAVDEDSPFHDPCHATVLQAREDPSPSFLTWNVCYEFLRVTTHPRASVSPWTAGKAWGFLEGLLKSPGFDLLTATPRHAAVLAQTLSELPDVSGNLCHDLHTAVLMREHGISRICTRDTDFHRFPFLTVVDPLR